MPRISERGTVSGGTSIWAINRISDSVWGFFNIVYFFFRSLIDPLVNAGGGSSSTSRSGSGYGRGPPRPPGGRRNIRTIADALGGSDSIPPPPPSGG